MSKIIAIDLGTTTSEISYMKDGKPVIIRNEKYGEGAVIPSVVTIKENEIIVGKKAKRQILLRPECTIAEVKRDMGTDKKFIINGVSYIPEQISAMILKTLKEIAEEELGDVSEAIITVPANFNDIQRNATKNAAAIAGLKVDRIINEPTAAALGYGLDNLDKDSKILVYDLGGGTFDCTVLEMFSGIMDVKASRGDNALGGKDFDKKIEEYIINYIKENTKVDVKSLNTRKLNEIKNAAERAKKDLSVESSTEIIMNNFDIDENGDSVDIEIELTKESFNNMVKDLIKRSEEIMDEALKAAGFTYEDIDVVLSIGGSSRMDIVKKLLVEKFGEEKIKKGINQDEAVALGAAVQAGIKSDEIKSDTGIIITDACSHTLGVEILGGRFSPIIFRDTKLPCKASSIYYTTYDGQTAVDVRVYQGESENIEEDTLIGDFELNGIPMARCGEEEIEVTFMYNLNGMLDVSAKILSTGKVEKRVMSITSLSPKDIKSLSESTFKDVEYTESKYENKINEDAWKKSKLFDIVSISVSLAEVKYKSLNDKNKEKIDILLNKIKGAILEDNKELVEKLDDELTDMLFEL